MWSSCDTCPNSDARHGAERDADGNSTVLTSHSLFRRLPSPIVIIITQYLPWWEKLTQLSRISRAAFPTVQPSAFAFDSLILTPAVLRAWTASASLRRLLSCMGAVLCRESMFHFNPDSPSPLLLSLLPPSSPTLTASFSAVRHLLLAGMGNDAPQDLLSQLVDAGQQRLASLQLQFRYVPNVQPMARPLSFWSPLAQLHGLHTLVVSQYGLALEYRSFRFLCSLPLTQLDLTAVNVAHTALAVNSEAELELPAVTDTWQLLRLPRCRQPGLAHTVESLMLPQQRMLRYLGLDGRSWADTVSLGLCSLVSLELRSPDSAFEPQLLLDAGTDRPLLPHLKHLAIGRQHHEQSVSVGQADSSVQAMAQLLRCYQHQLTRIQLHALIGSCCRPLLQAVFSCSLLRHAELSINFRLRNADHPMRPDFRGVLAALRSDAGGLPSLLQLHTLQLNLPLSPAELQSVLAACPALLELRLGQIHALDALQCTRLIAQQASPTLRKLRVTAMLRLTEESNTAVPNICTASLSPSLFPALIAFTVDGHLPTWTEPALQSLAQLLRHAPLRYLDIWHAPLEQLHHLSPLLQLRSLYTSASGAGDAPVVGVSMPAECHRFFHLSTTDGDGAARLCSGSTELRRRLFSSLIDDEEPAVSDEQLERESRQNWPEHCVPSPSRHVFVREPLFDGRDGREAYMEFLLRHNSQQHEAE